ncbi:MAG: hypothetical protein GY928_37655 [Colwellia sp.]|nr:hypothetical protein [Colwellia sp.]
MSKYQTSCCKSNLESSAAPNLHYTQATSKCRIQLELETPLGEALVEDNSYSIIKVNNDG